MHRTPGGVLRDLLAAAETVGHDQRVRVGRAHRRQQRALGECLRHGKTLPLKAERPGHAAATRLDKVHVAARRTEGRHFIFHIEERPLMAVHMKQHLLLRVLGLVVRRALEQKLGEQHHLLFQRARARIVGQQIHRLIAEHAGAARLEHNDGRAGGEGGRERIHRVGEIVLCPVEHAEVVQRPAAAHVTFEHWSG